MCLQRSVTSGGKETGYRKKDQAKEKIQEQTNVEYGGEYDSMKKLRGKREKREERKQMKSPQFSKIFGSGPRGK
jgi:hypothetical protein